MLSNTYPRKRSKNVSCVEGLGSLWGAEVTEGQSRSQRPRSFFQHMTKGTPGDEVDRGGVKKFPAPGSRATPGDAECKEFWEGL